LVSMLVQVLDDIVEGDIATVLAAFELVVIGASMPDKDEIVDAPGIWVCQPQGDEIAVDQRVIDQ